MRETREPFTPDRHDQRAAERQAIRDVFLFALVLGGAVLINAVLGLFLIEVFGSLEPRPTGNLEREAVLSRRLGPYFAPVA